MSLLENATFKRLEKSLDVLALRQKVIANNIANVDTPNFKRSEVRFEELLQSEMKSGLKGYRTHQRHIPIGRGTIDHIEPQIVQVRDTAMNNNQNNVDIDAEMVRLAENQISYNVLVQQINHHLSMTRKAIGGNRT